jgi:hypothetical protein
MITGGFEGGIEKIDQRLTFFMIIVSGIIFISTLIGLITDTVRSRALGHRVALGGQAMRRSLMFVNAAAATFSGTFSAVAAAAAAAPYSWVRCAITWRI